jgi:hypothetical protein
MRKLGNFLGIALVAVLIYMTIPPPQTNALSVIDQYLFKVTSSAGALKEVRMDTDGKIYTVTTANVENVVPYLRQTSTAFDSTGIPSVTGLTHFTTVAEQPTITYFTGGVEGQTIYIKATLDSLFINDSDTLDCGSASLTLDTNSVAVFRLWGSSWSLISVMNTNTDNN